MRAAALGLGLLLFAQPEPQKLPEPRTLAGGVRVLAREKTNAKRPGRCVTSVAWPELHGLASAQLEAALNRELEKLWSAGVPFQGYDCDDEDAKKVYALLSYGVESLRGFTFSLESGARLELGRALLPAARATLARRVERELMADAGASSLKQGGFLVEKIELREDGTNLCPTDDGLEVRFDPYEVGPYAMGMVRATLPYPEIRPLFPPAFRAVLQD